MISVPGASLACGRLRAFHSNQRDDFIYLRVYERLLTELPGNEVAFSSSNFELWIGANGEDSYGEEAAMLRPRRLAEEAQGRPVESEAISGKEQRRLTNPQKF
ncbi:hypothetical protein FZC76_01795 [Sutcliffiella horikoshii]|uniref:Uncharacterized protein n=1 Tax=Sutcliffiella horikoshii TaxID=79883 RepID=A0A5D4T5V1_9BACI|nr:hypothetical protein [Sutcliffiella horikoshii]TYS70649.1 hypothetical protein FZC76_01795 [Sutcliffiella horikoshii]